MVPLPSTSTGLQGAAMHKVSIADQFPLLKQTADVLPDSVKPALHDTFATCPKAANCADTDPFAGACNAMLKHPATALEMHVGSATLQALLGKQTAASVCDKTKPALQAKNTTSPVLPAVALLDPLPGATIAGVHASASHVGVSALKLPAAVHDVDAAPFNV
jgi:hypothetical protein